MGRQSAVVADCCIQLLWSLRYLLTVFLFASLSAGAVYAKGVEVKKISSRVLDGVYRLDVQLDYQPSDVILEALEHGVALTFRVNLKVRRKGAWVWENDVVDWRLRYMLRYHALSSMYELFLPDLKRPQRFATRDGALRALGELTNFNLVEASRLEADEQYLLRLKVKLDIESLPVPLRPRAYLSQHWSLSSEQSWPLK